MSNQARIMAVLAHPDDETLGFGGLLARYAAEGAAVSLVTATRGELGWPWEDEPYPGEQALGQRREGELRRAAEALGLEEVHFLDYIDGQLDQADPQQAARQVAEHIRRWRPQVLLTFDPHGIYGHPDHIAICQIATAAVMLAAAPDPVSGDQPHSVSKLYYAAETQEALDRYEGIFGEIRMQIDGQERAPAGWEPWAVTTRIEAGDYWQYTWRAIECHQSQLPGLRAILEIPDDEKCKLFEFYTLYRVFSLVETPAGIESDLLAGLRQDQPA